MESWRNIARTWEFLMQDVDPNLWIFKRWYAFWMSEEVCWSDVCVGLIQRHRKEERTENTIGRCLLHDYLNAINSSCFLFSYSFVIFFLRGGWRCGGGYDGEYQYHIFWGVTPHNVVATYVCFGGTYYTLLQDVDFSAFQIVAGSLVKHQYCLPNLGCQFINQIHLYKSVSV